MKTQIGLPVQLFGNTLNGRKTFAAIIVGQSDSLVFNPRNEIDLVVYDKDGSSFFTPSVSHRDFQKEGENYWDFIKEECDCETNVPSNENGSVSDLVYPERLRKLNVFLKDYTLHEILNELKWGKPAEFQKKLNKMIEILD